MNSSLSISETQSRFDPAHKATFTFDARAVVSADSCGTVRRWDSRTGACILFSFKYRDFKWIYYLTLSPDGKQLAASVDDKLIRVWDTETDVAAHIFKEKVERVCSLAYSPCERWTASASIDYMVKLWDIYETEQSFVVGEFAYVSFVRFSPSGCHLIIGSPGDIVRFFDVQSRIILSFDGLTDDASTAFAYSSNDQQLAIGTDKQSTHLWDCQSKKPSVILDARYSPVHSISFSSCDRWIAFTSGSNYTVQLWSRQSSEVESWSIVTIVHGFFSFVLDIEWDPVVPMEFVTGWYDGSVREWCISRDGDGEGFVGKMVWDSNIRNLCAAVLVLKGTIGLDAINHKLLVQRGAIDDTMVPSREDELGSLLSSDRGWIKILVGCWGRKCSGVADGSRWLVWANETNSNERTSWK